jgi:hypothetical protein
MVMRNYSRAVWVGVLVALALAGCSQIATPIAFGDVCDPGHDHQRISTVGYFDVGVTVFCSDTGGDYHCGLDFVGTPGSANVFTADILEGDRPNQMAQVPEEYSAADIRLKTADGTVIGVEQKVRITGEMLIGEGVCLMSVDKIEALTE